MSDKELDSLRAVLSRNADVFSKHKADIGCCKFVEHEIEIEEGSVPHREGARRMHEKNGGMQERNRDVKGV